MFPQYVDNFINYTLYYKGIMVWQFSKHGIYYELFG